MSKQDLLARTYQEAIQENKELKEKLDKIKELIKSGNFMIGDILSIIDKESDIK